MISLRDLTKTYDSTIAVRGLAISGAVAPAEVLGAYATVAGRVALVAVGSLVACTLIVAQLVIQNGIAALFPAWVRITPTGRPGGVEMIGQSLVVMYGGILALAVAAVVPGAAAAAALFVSGGMLLPAMLFASVLLVECYVGTEIVGHVLDRTDLQDVYVAEQ